jgi:hypothetical protein
MARKSENVIRFDFSPERLMQIMLNPEFQVARDKANGSLESRLEEKSRTDARFVYSMHTRDYARGMTGIDKSKIEDNHCDYEWDLKARRATWTYHPSAQLGPVKVWGTIRVEADGAGTRLTNTFEVEVKIPLIGGQAEKMVLKEVDKSWAGYERVIREYHQKMA